MRSLCLRDSLCFKHWKRPSVYFSVSQCSKHCKKTSTFTSMFCNNLKIETKFVKISVFPDVLNVEAIVSVLFQCFPMFLKLKRKCSVYFIVPQCSTHWNKSSPFISVFPNVFNIQTKGSFLISVFLNVLIIRKSVLNIFQCLETF